MKDHYTYITSTTKPYIQPYIHGRTQPKIAGGGGQSEGFRRAPCCYWWFGIRKRALFSTITGGGGGSAAPTPTPPLGTALTYNHTLTHAPKCRIRGIFFEWALVFVKLMLFNVSLQCTIWSPNDLICMNNHGGTLYFYTFPWQQWRHKNINPILLIKVLW